MTENKPKYLSEKGDLAMKRFNEFSIFRSNLIMLRASHNVSAEQLSIVLGVRPKRVSDYEIGRCHPSFDEIRAIAKHFNVTLDQLLYKQAKIIFVEL